MDGMRPQRVSVLDPIGPAVEQVRIMLFAPFDISKWLVIGFCAWLAMLGRGGGPTFNFNVPGGHYGPEMTGIRESLLVHLPWLIIGACFLIPLFIVLWVVFCWLSSRGQFMFVHCIAANKGEVVQPWKKFGPHADSLFLFRIIFGLIAAAVIILFCVPAGIVAVGLQAAGFGAWTFAGLAGFIVLIIIASILVIIVAKFTFDFVVPIMFLHTASCVAAWRYLLALIGVNKARFLLYILFQIVLALVIGAIVSAVCLIGCCCCCASVLLLVPYVGTVILLPLFAFTRSYSLFYLRQFGPRFDVFIPRPLPAPQ